MARGPHVRQKNGVETTALDPRGTRRDGGVAPAVGRRSSADARLLLALLLRSVRTVALKQGRPVPDDVPAMAALDSRIDRAMRVLRESPEGRAAIARETAVAASCAHAVTFAVRAAPNLLEAVVAGCAHYGALTEEHRLEITAARTHALRSALFGVLSDVLVGRAFEFGPTIVAATNAEAPTATGKRTVSIGGFGDAVKLAGTCAQNARHELMLALQLQREADEAAPRGHVLDAATAARIAAIRARNEAEAAQPEEPHDDAPEADEPEDEETEQDVPMLPPAPVQSEPRPTPREVTRPPVPEVMRWLPPELHPWAPKFAHLGSILVPFQRAHAVTQIAGSLQIVGTFGRDEARVMGAVQKWRALVIATGSLPTNEEHGQ